MQKKKGYTVQGKMWYQPFTANYNEISIVEVDFGIVNHIITAVYIRLDLHIGSTTREVSIESPFQEWQ